MNQSPIHQLPIQRVGQRHPADDVVDAQLLTPVLVDGLRPTLTTPELRCRSCSSMIASACPGHVLEQPRKIGLPARARGMISNEQISRTNERWDASPASRRSGLGQHPLHVRFEPLPAVANVEAGWLEVVDDDETALSRHARSASPRDPSPSTSRADKYATGYSTVRIVQAQRVRLPDVGAEVADLVHDVHQVLFR